MKKKINEKSNIFDNEEISKLIENCKEKEINDYYEKSIRAINTIYKYYDSKGNRKI